MMWVTYTAIALIFASLLTAQTDPSPTCSNNCFATFLNSSSCGINLSCACQNSSVINDASCCLYVDCDGSDQSDAFNVLSENCLSVGVNVNVKVCHIYASVLSSKPSSTTANGAATSTQSTSIFRNQGTTSTTALTSTTSGGTDTSSTTPSTQSTSSVSGGSSLPSGAIAGIAVGAVVVGALAAVIIVWMLLKNRKAKKSNDGGEATEHPDTSIVPGKSELQGKASLVIAGQDRGRGAIADGGNHGGNGGAEKDVKTAIVPVATGIPEMDTARQTLHPSELSSQPYPSELSPQHIAYEAPADGLPVPDLAAYPYAHSVADAPGAQYGPIPHPSSPSVTAVGTPVPPDAMQPFQHNDEALYDHQPLPIVTHLASQSPDSQGQSHPVAWPPEPSVDELSQLMREQTELEARRQTLLQLQQIQEQQAALRDRIAAAQQQTRQDDHP